MAYYLLFDKNKKLIGYSTFKKMAYGLISQRKDFQKFNIQKVKDDFLDKPTKHELYMSGGDIFEYKGIYIFEHEQDQVHTECMEEYKKILNVVELYVEKIGFIKMKEKEIEPISEITSEIMKAGESIYDEYFASDEPMYDYLMVDKIVIDILKNMYKEE